MPLYYFECSKGCGIREAKSMKQAKLNLIREVGEYDLAGYHNTIRLATEKDIGWIRAMGGYIPKGGGKRGTKGEQK